MTDAICAALAPPETILRPGAPSEGQLCVESGLPERSGEVGRGTSGEIRRLASSARSMICSSSRPRTSRSSSTPTRSEEYTSELQSRGQLVCRLLLEKKTNKWPDQHE